MKDSLREELIKEYEMLIEKSMEKIEEEQVKLVKDDMKSKNLAVLYVKALKVYIRNDYEEGEKAVNKYLERIIEMKNIQEKEHIETIKNKVCEMIKQGIAGIDEPIKKFFDYKTYYDDILKDANCLEEDWVEINEEKEGLTNKEIDIFKRFACKILNEINSEIKKIDKTTDKSRTRAVLEGVTLALIPFAGTYLFKKVGEKAVDKAKDTVLNMLLKNIVDDNKGDKKNDVVSNVVNCINKPNSLTRDI